MTHDQIVARLEEAGRTLLSLPPARAQGHMRVSTWGYVREMVHSMAEPTKARPTPTPREIDSMEEALAWVSKIPDDQFVLRRIVCARLLVSPLTGKHFYAWRRIGTKLGADHKAVQRWHEQGIQIIARALAANLPREAA
jgi:hypothetical protein